MGAPAHVSNGFSGDFQSSGKKITARPATGIVLTAARHYGNESLPAWIPDGTETEGLSHDDQDHFQTFRE